MFGMEIWVCFAVLWLVVCGMAICLVRSGSSLFHVGFAVAPDNDGHLFWECTFPPLVEIRENPEFHDLMTMDKAHWPRCLLWHGWLPMLSGVNGVSLWAAGDSETSRYLLEAALGQCSSWLVAEWSPSVEFDEAQAAFSMPDHPNVWTDGSLVLDRGTGVSSSGRRWGHVDGIRADADLSSCRGFFSVPGPFQSVHEGRVLGCYSCFTG